jgi:ABC-type branched-subunit amino acid transport system substrate-binding protein
MSDIFTRRQLIRAALPLAGLPLVSHRVGAALTALTRRQSLRVGVLLPRGIDGDRAADLVTHGVALGADESRRTAALFGLDVQLLQRRARAPEETMRSAQQLLSSGLTALVVASEADQWQAIARLAAEQRTLFVSVGSPPEGVADACDGFAVHLGPAAATIQRAETAYARRPGAHADDRPRVALWHHTLRRFGAEQLNQRFRRGVGREMDSAAWAGWAAIKILTEAALRARSSVGADVARYLARPTARFDGHKGEPLTFDAHTGELRQPLYIVVGDPDRGHGDRVAAELSAAEAYGPIASARGASACDSAAERRRGP